MHPVRSWDRWLFAPVSARPLGAFRIAFGLICLANLALLAADPDEWLTGIGYLQGPESREIAGPLRPSILQWAQAPGFVRLFLVGTAAVAVLFAIGWRTRAMGVLLYLAQLSIHHRNLMACSGADVLLICTSFYLMLAPCGAAYSLDARRRSRRGGAGPSEPVIRPWSLRLIQFQVSLVYFSTALIKAGGTTWNDGTATHYVLANTEYRRWTFGLPDDPTLTGFLTLGALFVEFALAFLLWVKAARPYAIAAGMLLHGGIALTVNIPIFGELLVASYLTFLTGTEWDSLPGAFGVRRWGRRELTRPAKPSQAPPRSALRGPHFPTPAARTERS